MTHESTDTAVSPIADSSDPQSPQPADAPQVSQEESPGIISTAEPIKLTDEEVIAVTQAVISQPIQGQIVEEKPKHPGGRPTKYNEEMYRKIKKYFDDCFNGVRDSEGKLIKPPSVPYIEELELMLDIDDDTIVSWANDPDKIEFSATYNKLKKLQKLRLKQILVRGKTNPMGAKFLLEAEYGLMASEKQILVADRDVKVSITRE